MLDRETRTAILRLHREGHGKRRIARALGVSRNAVKKVLRSGRAAVPAMQGRETALDGELNRIRELHAECKGNQVRVHEKLADAGIVVAYSTLTAFCRRHRIGVPQRDPVGRYEYQPGEEMQHDTSPHDVAVEGRVRRVQCASLVLGYSRRIFAQVYPRWTRLECRGFLTEGLRYHDGAAARCTIDNSSVIRLRGTGALMEPAPAMAAFAERFGFAFGAYELGDKDRNALAERNFHYIENNFYPGRRFESFEDLNAQLRAWCDRVNGKPRRLWGHVKRVPDELYLAERPTLRALPLHVPEVYDLHSRLVGVEGYVSLHRNRYSVPARWLRRRVEVRETLTQVRVFVGHELVAEHDRVEAGAGQRVTLPGHRTTRQRKDPPPPSAEETTLRAAAPEFGELVSQLRARHGGQALRTVRRLHRFYLEYPTDHLVAAVRDALRFGLLDLARIERMTLRRIRGDFFRLPEAGDEENDVDDELDQLLQELKLRRLPDILDQELERATKRGVSYLTFLKRLLRQERDAQVVRAMEYRIKRAKLPERWSLGTYPWDKQPSLERRVIEQLAELHFVDAAENIVFIGATGTGKTGLASALLLEALTAGYRGLFIKAQDLFDEMYASLADHSSRRLLNRLSRIDLLVIDEMGYLNLRPEQTNIFFKLMEERYGRRATILTTNLEYEAWHDFLGNKAMVLALLDRLRHRCHTIRIDGPSLRDPTG